MDEIYRLVVLLPAAPTEDMRSVVIFHLLACLPHEEAGACPSCLQARGGVHPECITSSQRGCHTERNKQIDLI